MDGDTRLRRGTRALRPSATLQDAPTARKYDWTIAPVLNGVDLFAFALLMATLRDWLVICQRRVPVVCANVSMTIQPYGYWKLRFGLYL